MRSRREGRLRVARDGITRAAFLRGAGALALVAAGAITASSLGGCSASDGAAEENGLRTDAVLVLGCGVCANRPALDRLPDGATEILTRVLETGGSLGIVSVEGEPRSFGTERLGSGARTERRRALENQAALEGVAARILAGEYAATTPEADPLGALQLAARSLAAVAGEDGDRHVVICDSLLGTAGAIDFTEGMTLASDAQEVLTYLKGQESLPDLSGVTVSVFFAGDVAAPQQELSGADRANLIEIWRTALTEGCGAVEVSFMPDVPASTAVSAGAFPDVSPVPVSSSVPFTGAALAVGSTFALGDAERVTFKPDSSSFLDEEGARSTLEALADEFARSGAVVEIEGNTASLVSGQSEEAAQELSRDRARCVADLLVAGGLPAGRIRSVRGNGSRGGVHSRRVEDVDADGHLIPAAAQENRSVVIAVVEMGAS